MFKKKVLHPSLVFNSIPCNIKGCQMSIKNEICQQQGSKEAVSRHRKCLKLLNLKTSTQCCVSSRIHMKNYSLHFSKPSWWGGGIFLLPGFLKSLKVKSADNVSYLNADTSWSNKELTDKFEKTIYFRVGSEKYLWPNLRNLS